MIPLESSELWCSDLFSIPSSCKSESSFFLELSSFVHIAMEVSWNLVSSFVSMVSSGGTDSEWGLAGSNDVVDRESADPVKAWVLLDLR